MSVIELIAQLQAHDIQLYLEDEKLKINAPKGVPMREWLEKIKSCKPEIISLLKQASEQSKQAEVIPIADRNTKLPIAIAQQRLWFIDQLQHDSSYNLAGAFEIIGPLNIKILEQAFTELVKRQEQLRANFKTINGQPEVIVNVPMTWSITTEIILLEQLPKKLQQFKVKCFDLAHDVLIRTKLFQTGSEKFTLAIAMHHIITDAWSLGIVCKELSYHYKQALNKEKSSLPELEVQYLDYVAWQNKKLRGDYLTTQIDFWEKNLESCPILELPSDFPRKANQTSQAERVKFNIGPERLSKLKDVSRQFQVTLFITLLAAYKVLLYRTTGQADICVGVPSSYRQSLALEALVGFFINSLPLRSDLSDSPTFAVLLQQLHNSLMHAEQHKELPFEQLLENVGLDRDLSHPPIFQTMFSLEHRSKDLDLHLEGVKTKFFPLENEQTKFDLTLTCFEFDGNLNGEFEYDGKLFRPETIHGFVNYFCHILDQISNKASLPLAKISLLPKIDQDKIINQWSGKHVYRNEINLVKLFDQSVSKNPFATAVEVAGEKYSYRDLQQRANKLANYLIENGISENKKVSILCERSYELIIAILAVTKAGGVYLPVDRKIPENRLLQIVNDAKPGFILTQENLISSYNGIKSELPNIICLDSDWHRVSYYSTDLNRCTTSLDVPLYIIYTSGSTGLPKGVVVPERGVWNLVEWHASEFFQDKQPIRMGQVAGAAFDAAAWEIWSSLCKGASLILAAEEARISAKEMVGWIAKENITHIFLPTPLAEAVLAEPLPENWALKYMFTGGEKLNQYPPRNCSFKLINAYGPTECSVVATAGEVKPQDNHGALPSIGKPITNARIYILDNAKLPVPAGITGELYIGGEGVAKEYLNNPESTRERFLNNPFAAGKLYRTGDLARWLPNGEISFCGRADEQVQIRGFRVELGEIENTLNRLPDVKESVVRYIETQKSGNHLVAYLITNTTLFDESAVRHHAKETLPDYMLPSVYCVIDEIPFTPNGKIDFKQLPNIEQLQLSDSLTNQALRPSSVTEEAILNIWKEILQKDSIRLSDNFFQIGGHSLLATRVMARLRELYSSSLPLRLIFENPSIVELAASIDTGYREKTSEVLPLVPVSRKQTLPLTFSQERLWVLDRLESGSGKYNSASAYNIASAFHLKGVLKLEALTHAFSQIMKRHEILRTTFSHSGVDLEQVIMPARPWRFSIEDVSSDSELAQLESIALVQQQESSRAFDLEESETARRTRLIRTRLLKLHQKHFILFITLHHIIADGWSVEIISRELSYFYNRYLGEGSEDLPPLAELPIQYADYAIWQRKSFQENQSEKSIAYWQEKLANIEPLELFSDFPRPAKQTYTGSAFNTEISQQAYNRILQLAQQLKTTPFVIMLTAYRLLLSNHSGQTDFCIGTPVAHRPFKETENLIGFFVSTLALRGEIISSYSFSEIINLEQQNIIEAFDYQDAPFEKIVDALSLPRDLSRSPVFQTLFSFQQSDLHTSLNLSALEVEQLPQKNTASQFELSLAITETPQGIQARWDYNTDLFSERSISGFSRHYNRLLEILLDSIDTPIKSLKFLNEEAYRQQIYDWNNTEKEYPKVQALHYLFEKQARATPDKVAIKFEQEEVSYGELNIRANQLAQYLLRLKVSKNTPVAVCMQRSIDLVVTLYAILKSGAAYLPLDVSAPAKRLQDMLDDADVNILITENTADVPVLSVEYKIIYATEQANLERLSPNNPQIAIQEDDLAYVIYTSGSTGKPKGVAVPHKGVINRLLWMQDAYPLSNNDVVLQKTPCSFDVSVWEFFWPLFTGASLVVAKPEGHKDTDYLCQLIKSQEVTTLHFVPSMLSLFLSHRRVANCDTLRTVFCSGEALKTEHCRKFFELFTDTRLINLYGPTEASIDVSVWECKKDHLHARVPIGKPIANTQLYILDEDLKLLPTGVPGELYIGGVGLAQGYLGQAELTAEHFIPSPFPNKKNVRLYKTGDKVRFLPDGNIEYLGRLDFQVKLRGLRIELGDIENQLNQLGFIKENVVVLSRVKNEEHLLAYVTSDKTLNTDEVKFYLRERLPEYMVPSAIIQISAMPLSPNGKIDRKALPAWIIDREDKVPFVAPRNASETYLAQLWCEFLKLDAVSVHDNFFELGGHSLLAAQIISRIRLQYEVEISLAELFEKPTIEALAIAILKAEAENLDEPILKDLIRQVSGGH